MAKLSRQKQSIRTHPRWLQQLQSLGVATIRTEGFFPPWQESLWSLLPKGEGTQPALRQVLRFPAVTTCSTIGIAQGKVTCGMGSPIVSTQGTHGVHFFLKTALEECTVLLLTPATFARLHGEGTSSYAKAPVHSLEDRFIVLESMEFRAEFSVSKVEYEQEQPEDLLRSLEAKVVLWYKPK